MTRWLLILALLQPPMESSRGTYPIPRVVGMSGEAFIFRVDEERVISYHGLRHFDLIGPDGLRLSVMGDADLDAIKALGQHDGQKVRIVIERFEAQGLER